MQKIDEHHYDPDCQCASCQEQLALFNDWCNEFNERWQNRKLAREHHDCGPLCPTHGDVRDHSAVR